MKMELDKIFIQNVMSNRKNILHNNLGKGKIKIGNKLYNISYEYIDNGDYYMIYYNIENYLKGNYRVNKKKNIK